MLVPGITYYISLWYASSKIRLEIPGAFLTLIRYTRADAQLRMAMVFASASTAGAFSGLLAYGIVKMDGIGGLRGWRWMFVLTQPKSIALSLIYPKRFILEGILTVIVALLAYWIIPDEPATAKFLSNIEKNLAISKLRIDRPQSHFAASPDTQEQTVDNHFKWKYVWAAFTDWQV